MAKKKIATQIDPLTPTTVNDSMYDEIRELDTSQIDSIINAEEIPRPGTFEEFVGQELTKQRLRIVLMSAIERKRTPDHILITGGSGLGKTTLAHIASNTLKTHLIVKNGTQFTSAGDIQALALTIDAVDLNKCSGVLVFIDEIHMISKRAQEAMLTMMESKTIEVQRTDSNTGKHYVKLYLPNFSIIGATTNESTLTKPMLDRFSLKLHLVPYDIKDMISITERNARLLIQQMPKKKVAKIACLLVAQRSRSTARIAANNLKYIFHYMITSGKERADRKTTIEAFKIFGVNKWGFADEEIRIIMALYEHKKPTSLKNLSGLCGINIKVIEDIHQPYLFNQGIMDVMVKGRYLTPKGAQIARAIKAGEIYE